MAVKRRMRKEGDRLQPRKDVILFTGQSGIGIEGCLQRLIADGEPREVEIVKIEKEMIDLYKTLVPAHAKLEPRRIFRKILSLPPARQGGLWSKSFQVTKKKLGQRAAECYLVAFHASYYHQASREFLSPIDLMGLRTLKNRVKMVVNLIDDSLDVYRRLLAKGQMFNRDIFGEGVEEDEAIFRSVWNLLTILSWREIEIAFSRKIAETLGVPMYIVAVKHPKFMVERLVFKHLETLRIFYLAHPITSVRRGKYEVWSKFANGLNSLAEELLKQHKHLVIFLPDTIDELRMRKEPIGQARRGFVPEFDERWPLPFGDQMLISPLSEDEKRINPLNPRAHELRDAKVQESVSHAIQILVNKMDQQITSRDYALVEQSGAGMIAFQPYFNGGISRGALKETEYNKELAVTGPPRRTFILEKDKNLRQYRISAFFIALLNALAKPDEEMVTKLHDLEEQWKNDRRVYSTFGDRDYSLENVRAEIEKIIPDDYEFQEKLFSSLGGEASLKGTGVHERDKRVDEGWQILGKIIAESDPFRQNAIDDKDYLLARDDVFDRESYSLLNNSFKAADRNKTRRSK